MFHFLRKSIKEGIIGSEDVFIRKFVKQIESMLNNYNVAMDPQY